VVGNMKTTLGLMLALVLLAGTALADSYTWNGVSSNLNNAGPVSGTMTVTTTLNGFDVTVVNLIADPGNQGQIITGLEFKLNSSLSSTMKTNLNNSQLQSSSAIVRDISSDGTYVQSGPSQTDWQLSSSFFNGGLALCASGCGTWHPEGVIGDPGTNGLYNNANPSITNNQHSPELYGTVAQPVTFHVYAAGVTTSTSVASLISGANFVFGTSGTQLTGTPGTPPPPPSNVPEPSSIMLFGSGLLGTIGAIRRKFKI
jgi:hypothetical protein